MPVHRVVDLTLRAREMGQDRAVERELALVKVAGHGEARGEALRYLIASIVALALDIGLLWLGTREFAMASWLAGAFAYAAGLVLVYVLSVRWVFAHRAVRDARSEFLVFAALGLGGLLLNSATLFFATGFGLALPFAKGLSAAIGFVTNFVSRKLLLFSTDPS